MLLGTFICENGQMFYFPHCYRSSIIIEAGSVDRIQRTELIENQRTKKCKKIRGTIRVAILLPPGQ